MDYLKNDFMNASMHDRFLIVVDWLKFAEAKHIGLIALNGGGIFGFLSNYPKNVIGEKYFMGFILLGLSSSILVSLVSFIPILTRAAHISEYSESEFEAKKDSIINSIYFDCLARVTPSQFLRLMTFKEGLTAFTKADEDLADQIYQVSRVTKAKMAFFRCSAWLTIFALVVGIVNIFFAI